MQSFNAVLVILSIILMHYRTDNSWKTQIPIAEIWIHRFFAYVYADRKSWSTENHRNKAMMMFWIRQSHDFQSHACTVWLTTCCNSNSIQSNIKCLVDSTLVRYHTVVDPRHTTGTSVQAYHTRPPGYGEVPSSTVRWDCCSIWKVPVPKRGTSSFCTRAAGYVVWSHTEQWVINSSVRIAELPSGHETMIWNSCPIEQLQIDTCR